MSRLWLSLSLLPLLTGCDSDPASDQPLSCADAVDVLAGCEGSAAAHCADDGPAAQRLAEPDCSTGGKADVFGNRVEGEPCSWSWQCSFDEGLLCVEDACGHVSVEDPCALPTPSYLALSGWDKQAALFELHQRSELVDLGSVGNAASALAATVGFLPPHGGRHIAGTMMRTCDVFAEPQSKQVHALGSTAKARWVIEDGSPYTGLLASGEVPALIRFSIANPITGAEHPDFVPDPEFIPGIGIKLLVDGQPSQNVVAMESLAGQGNDHNFFLHAFSNNFSAMAPTSGNPHAIERYGTNALNREVMEIVGRRFEEVLNLLTGEVGEPFHRTVSPLAGVDAAGRGVPDVASPDWLVFRPTSEVRDDDRVTDSSPGVDFRIKLGGLREEQTVYEIYAVEDDQERRIGRVVLESVPKPSAWGDRELFIQHTI